MYRAMTIWSELRTSVSASTLTHQSLTLPDKPHHLETVQTPPTMTTTPPTMRNDFITLFSTIHTANQQSQATGQWMHGYMPARHTRRLFPLVRANLATF